MKKFMDDDFLLETETAKLLFHKYAKNTPIIDYHCHIDAKEIAEDIRYLIFWLPGDNVVIVQLFENSTVDLNSYIPSLL